MTFPIHALRTHKQLVVLLLWLTFIGWAVWQHALQSQHPPIWDPSSYYLKAYNFWTQFDQHKPFNPFNVEPSFRPPGTILMSYPFGFDIDYRGFYFRSVFLPIALLSLAVVIGGGYRRELDSKSKWLIVLFASFFSSLPCFYHFETALEFPGVDSWGLVDNFLAGVAALATAVAVRSIWTRSLAWVGLAAVLSSLCLLIKPAGALVMMLIGLTWFGLTTLKLKSVWQSPDERKSTTRWLLRGIIIFAVPYFLVLAGSFTSHYLSPQNLAFGKSAIAILKTDFSLSWYLLLNAAQMYLGYSFVVWIFLISIVVNYLWRTPTGTMLWPRPLLVGLILASCITFIFGIWFWIFGTGDTSTNIRYFIPFLLMAVILSLPAILTAVRAMSGWKMAILSVLMIAPVINISILLPQRDASIEWQKWTGINLSSGASDAALVQAQNFAGSIKRDGRNVTLYFLRYLDMVDADFQSVIDFARIATSSMPTVSILRPVDWQRPTTYRKEEMLAADYWLLEPVRDPRIAYKALTTASIDDLEHEYMLFQAWATQLTTNEGVTVVSDTPTARVLRITDAMLLESAFDALVEKHHWRDTFVTANPKRRFSEKEVTAALALNPPSLENVNFGDRFHLRALSISRIGDDTTVRFWWNPLSPLIVSDWKLFIHSINDTGEIILNNEAPIRFNQSLSSIDGVFMFDQVSFRNPVGNGTHRLAIGFYRPNQEIPLADKGMRDWGNRRVIVPLP